MFISTAYNFLDDSAFILALSGFAYTLMGYLYKVITLNYFWLKHFCILRDFEVIVF